MKCRWVALVAFLFCSRFAVGSDVSIPDRYIQLIKTADYVEVTGTSDLGAPESFTIHNAKAIAQFVALLTSQRFTPVPKNLMPHFKSRSAYKVSLSSKGAPVLNFRVIGDSVLELPHEPMFYMEADDYSENLMAPLLRLR